MFGSLLGEEEGLVSVTPFDSRVDDRRTVEARAERRTG